MERPRSQLENVRPSGIKPPSKLPAMSSRLNGALQDTSQSDLNTKTAREGGMQPPQITSNGKHKMTGLHEPISKRKTLIERAGEPLNTRSNVPQPRATTSRSGFHASHNSTGHIRPPSAYSISQLHARNTKASSNTNGQNGGRDEDRDSLTKRQGTSTPFLDSSNITVRKSRNRNDGYSEHISRAKTQHLGSLSDTYMDECAVQRGLGRYSFRTFSSPIEMAKRRRETRQSSLTSAMQHLSIQESPMQQESSLLECAKIKHRHLREKSPTKLPRSIVDYTASITSSPTPRPLTSLDDTQISIRKKPSCKEMKQVFLTKESLTSVPAWNVNGRLDDMDRMYADLQAQLNSAADTKSSLEDVISFYKTQLDEATRKNTQLETDAREATSDLARAREDVRMITHDLDQARKDHDRDQIDLSRRHNMEINDIRNKHEKEVLISNAENEKMVNDLEAEIEQDKQNLQKEKSEEIATLTAKHLAELEQLRIRHEEAVSALRQQIEDLKKSDEGRASESASQVESLRNIIASLQAQNEACNAATKLLQKQIDASEARVAALEQDKLNLISKAHFLEGNQEAQSQEFTNMTRRLQVAEATAAAATEQLRKEETVRRRLNAQILGLKGNIRVFARLRPVLDGEEETAKIEFPDANDLDGRKEVVFHAPTTKSATGKERNEKYNYAFDRVFGTESTNLEVFEDCRDLVQSVIDGYNVSILSYGQTGSGKTFGMSGENGIIPMSITMLLSEMQRLQEKGWQYVVEASFVEVYNETLNDLLGDAKSWDKGDDSNSGKAKSKHEIHHDAVTVDESNWPPAAKVDGYDKPEEYTRRAVSQLLETATKNRRVAATKANERSSRSHSVFTLLLKGSCSATGETSEGVLNLVDLAGSERLKHSGAEGNRAKETAAINTSLKSLGDVIEKVGSGGHVPYRNSKLTYLLQSSLGGVTNGKSSRTLLMLHISPIQAHWPESKTSLQFGVKVHGTHIGAAKKNKTAACI